MPAFDIARCFDFRNSSRCVLVSYCGFCFFQMKNDLMHLFIFIFVICLFFFGKVTIQNFAQYKNLGSFFLLLLLSFKSSFYILDTNSFSDFCFVKIFSQLWFVFSSS